MKKNLSALVSCLFFAQIIYAQPQPKAEIIYLADDAKITAPKNKWQENDLQTWLAGKPVGSLADSALNPLVL